MVNDVEDDVCVFEPADDMFLGLCYLRVCVNVMLFPRLSVFHVFTQFCFQNCAS